MTLARYSLFSHHSSIASALLDNNRIPMEAWGTDKDIKDCLGELLTINPDKQINQCGIYILPPVSLTEQIDAEAKEAVKHHIKETLKTIKDKHIHGRISLLIPVNCNGNHWRLARIYIDKYKITSAKLWDSLSGSSKSLKAQTAFENFLAACMDMPHQHRHLKVIATCAGLQTNKFSCMDYVLREIYRILKINNEISKAETPTILRMEIVRHIARQHPQLKAFADNLCIVANQIIIKNDAYHPCFPMQYVDTTNSETMRQSLEEIFATNSSAQEKFDHIYAELTQVLSNELIFPSELFLLTCHHFNEWVKEENTQHAPSENTLRL